MVTVTKNTDISFINYQAGSTSFEKHIPPVPTSPRGVIQCTRSKTHSGPVPRWKFKLAHGINATSEFSGTETSIEFDPGIARDLLYNKATKQFLWYEVYGDLAGFYQHAANYSISTTTADKMAKSAFISSVRSAHSAVQGMVVAGEIGETVRMLMNPAKAFRKGIDDYISTLKKRRTRSRSRNREILAETWLEYRFGWRPLIKDIEDANQALQDLAYRPTDIVRAKGFYKDSVLVSDRVSNNSYATLSWKYTERETTEAIVIYRAGVHSPIGNRQTLQNAKFFGFSFDQFFPTAWELLPYSFLIDYFTNIGDVISAWSLWDTGIAWQNKTVVTNSFRDKSSLNLDPVSPDANLVRSARYTRPSWASSVRKTVNRTSNVGSFVPDFRFTIPGTESLRWLNIAALAVMRGRVKPYY